MWLFKSKPKKDFNEILGINNTNWNIDDFQEVYRGKNEDGNEFADFGMHLEKPIFGVFDYLTLRMFGSEFILDKNKHLNLFLINKTQEFTINTIQRVTDYLVRYFGKDSVGSKYWDDSLDHSLEEAWQGRSWTSDRYGRTYRDYEDGTFIISIDYDTEDGFTLTILGYNNLL